MKRSAFQFLDGGEVVTHLIVNQSIEGSNPSCPASNSNRDNAATVYVASRIVVVVLSLLVCAFLAFGCQRTQCPPYYECNGKPETNHPNCSYCP